MSEIDVAPDTVVFYADLSSPWAHVAAHRLRRARAEPRELGR